MTIMPGPGQWRSSLSVSHNEECDQHYEDINPLSTLIAHTDLTSDDPRLGTLHPWPDIICEVSGDANFISCLSLTTNAMCMYIRTYFW